MSVDLYTLVFRVILRVSECSAGAEWGCLTGDVTHDFIYAFLLPHVVLFIFLFILAMPVRNMHSGLGVLFGVGAYIFIIYEGWYGAILAPLLMWWFVLSIIIGLGYFFINKFLGSQETRGKIGRSLGGKIKEGMKKEQALEYLQRDIEEYKRKLKNAKSGSTEKVYAEKLAKLREEKRKLQRGG